MTEYAFVFSWLQPTVADVVHCVLHRGTDLNEPDRRQVGADPQKNGFNPLLFYHPAECNTRFLLRSHAVVSYNFYDQEEGPNRYFPFLWSVYCVAGLDDYLIMWRLTHCRQFMCLIFPLCLSSHKIFLQFQSSSSTKDSLPGYLHDSVLSQYALVLFQFIHLMVVFSKNAGNHYLVTKTHRLWF